ncbi:MAG: DUF3015 domain-containing protein [Nitrospira sp.]|nr:DUF3015 domain-containing protein [Nitrospira sp.]MDH4343140.1 DUF3015 domain-containing protein [Nitrospira sp.]MDH5335591.1 DUF3015 domain-containing protein [Nitrospira sp.]
MRKSFRNMAAIGASLILGTTGCTLKATINQTTDTTSNITGTTSGAAWWSEDGQIKPDFKTTAFVTFNQANLQQDLAAGRGEYLASISRLLGVPANRQLAFFSAAQADYAETIGRDSTALLALLRDTSRAFIR